MTTGRIQTFDSLAWDGVADVRVVAAIGVALALAAAWLMWRERRTVGLAWATTFWLLRMGAFGCALWMLAGPTWLRVERLTTPQHIAVFADDSGSMDVIDPPNPAESQRWNLVSTGVVEPSPLTACDRLAVVLGAAQADCRKFAHGVKRRIPAARLKEQTAGLASLLKHAAIQVEAAAAALDERDAVLAARASRIGALLNGSASESLAALTSALESTRDVAYEDINMLVEQLSQSVSSARRRTVVLCADLAYREAGTASADERDGNGLSRRAKAGAALDAFESEVQELLADGAGVERYRFDRIVTPIEVTNGWASALSGNAVSPAERRAGDGGEDDDAEPPTNLSAVFEHLATEISAGGARMAVIITDGRHNDVDALPPQEAAAQLADLPIYLTPIGNPEQIRDALVHRVEAPTAVAENDTAVIDVIVTGYDCEGQTSAVVLRQGGREVDRRAFDFASNHSDYRAQFTVKAETRGWQEYIVEVEPIADESNTTNNFQPVSFEVVRNEHRVLLADSVARWEFRYLSQLFRRDEHVKCDELLFSPQVHGTGALADKPALPETVDEWSRYDVAILGDLGPKQLSSASQQALHEFVDRGGNLIIIAGQRSMPMTFIGQPLVDVLPVERGGGGLAQQGYVLRVTDEGSLNSALAIADSAEESRRQWDRIYRRFPVFALSEFSKPKPTAHMLLAAIEADGDDSRKGGERERAFLSWQRVGAGRVAYLAAPESYRLRWRRDDRLHHRFWGQLLRWMTAANAGAGVELVRLQTNRTRYLKGESVEATVWLRDPDGRPLAGESIRLEARSFDGAVMTAELTPDPQTPGRYFGAMGGLAPGAYQLVVGGRIIDELLPKEGDAEQVQTTIAVRAGESVELANTQSNRPLLQQVAEATGGQVIPPTALGELLRLVSLEPRISERVERKPIWNHWSNLFIVLGCLSTEWIVRKRKGLA
jgi:hypothetical protein